MIYTKDFIIHIIDNYWFIEYRCELVKPLLNLQAQHCSITISHGDFCSYFFSKCRLYMRFGEFFFHFTRVNHCSFTKCNITYSQRNMLKQSLTEQYSGAETSWVCVCTKRVCVCDKEPNKCTVGVYSVQNPKLQTGFRYQNTF